MVITSLNWLEHSQDPADFKFLKNYLGKHLTI